MAKVRFGERRCDECGSKFRKIRRGQRFCSPKCSDAYHNRRKRERYKLLSHCPHCGKEIFKNA